MNDTRKLPVLPLRDMVVLPGITVPIAAGREGTLAAIDAALEVEADEKQVFVVTQRRSEGEPTPDNLHTVGVLARILTVQTGPGGQQVVLDTTERARVLRWVEVEGSPRLDAEIAPMPDLEPLDQEDAAFVALVEEVRQRAFEYGRHHDVPEEALRRFIRDVDEPGVLANRVGFQLDAEVEQKQTLLETLPVEERLRKVLVLLERRKEIDRAQEAIRDRVQGELGDRQREMYLREQMKAIRQELGVEEEQQLAELRARLDELEFTERVREEVDKNLARAERLGRESAEAQVVWTWLEWVADLPWNARTEDLLDIDAARGVLDEDHHGLEDVKQRVLEFLAVRQLRAARRRAAGEEGGRHPGSEGSKGPILLFLGPPGTGKTSVARSIARALGRKYERVALGGARDEADIRGHRRTYVGALPGRIVHGLRRAGSRNPVFCLDEVDKLGRSFQGDPGSALLEVLDPAQNDTFEDRYLDVPFDLSEVLFLCTANFLEGIPGPLLDRMEVIEFAGYTEREKLAIARSYLLPRQMEEAALGNEQLEVTDAALAGIIGGWTREAGVRQLEREVGSLCRKVALRIAEGDTERVVVDEDDVRGLLGKPRVRPEKRLEEDAVGVATGMYYTAMGGDIMFVEASAIPGKGQLTLTGKLGEVMKESAHAALTYARQRAGALGIRHELLKETDLHVHVPAGAVPKDGPSAGVTMATAMVSALAGREVAADLAMTGEITLRGTVLPIGGVKEKLLGAARAGMKRVILPRANGDDLEDLPEDVRDSLEVILVDTLDEVLRAALVEPPESEVLASEQVLANEEDLRLTH